MLNSKKRKPEMIGWGITTRCNLSCPHCYSSAKRSSTDEMSTRKCIEILNEMIALGVETIGWTGGEPLLRNDLEELICYAREKGGIKSGITTNGILLHEKRILNLRKAGVSSIQISLDGSTLEKNSKMRGATEEDFHKIIQALRTCRRLELNVYLSMLLGEENLDDAYDFIKLAEAENVRSVAFRCFVPSGRGKAKTIQKRLSFSERLPELKSLVERYFGNGNPVIMFDPGFGPAPPDYNFHTCISGVETFYLSPEGNVYPCTSLLDEKFLIGNVKKKSLTELWNDPKMTSISSFTRGEIKGHCRKCRYFKVCRGACRGIVYAHTGDLHASFPTCLNRAEQEQLCKTD